MKVMIETEHLVLRPVSEADKDDLIALERDPEVMRFLNGGRTQPPDEPDETAPYLTPRGRETDVWAAVEKGAGAFIGWFSLRRGAEPGSAELGYRLRRSAWGHGYGSEGAKALVERGFAELGCRRIHASTMAANHASRRVMEKAGLKYVRTIHLNCPDPLPGNEQGDVEYEATRDALEPSVTFQRATEEDAGTVVAIEANIGDPKTYGQPLAFEAVVREIRKSAFYIIKEGDTVVGTAAYRLRSDNTAYLSNIAILPAYRGRGIGRAAMVFLLAQCREADTIDLVTHPENAAALNLYESLRFKITSRKEDYFGDGEPRLVLVRRREISSGTGS